MVYFSTLNKERFIDCVLGFRGAITGERLWESVGRLGKGTDYWKPYAEFVPEEQHVRSKAETYTVEGYKPVQTFSYQIAAQIQVLQQV